MKQPATINRNPVLTNSQDYAKLRKEGLDHIERLSSDLWTDYNSHDPGITLLELLCYAITDVGWRTRYPVKDFLADRAAGSPSGSRQFYTAREILTSTPVTINDFRKLLIDIRGVKNAWIEPVDSPGPDIFINHRRSRLQYEPEENLQKLNIRGLYNVLLELDRDPSAGDLNHFAIEIPLSDDVPLYQEKIIVDLPSWDRLFDGSKKPEKVKKVELKVTEPDGRFDFRGEVSVTLVDGDKLVRDVHVRTTSKDMPVAQIRTQIDRHGVEALYQQKITASLDIADRAWQVLHSHRNLCEDYYQLKGLDIEEVGLCVDINVSSDADLEKVWAAVIHAVSIHIAPHVPFHSLDELMKQGIPAEDIFNGPALDHGFITDYDLESSRLKTRINVSDLINLIMDIDGVVSIRSLSLASSYKGELVEKKAEWRLNVTEGRAARLFAEKSKIVFYKDDVPFTAGSERSRLLLRDLQLAERVSKLSPEEDNDFEIPVGKDRDVSGFTSVRVDLPDTYGVNRNGLRDPVTPEKKARAAQLKAFLTLFDQLLANYLAQLASLRHLFSFDHSVRKTYFTQVLFSLPESAVSELMPPGSGMISSQEEPPRIWLVLMHFIRFLEDKGLSPDELDDREQLQQLRSEFLATSDLSQSELNAYLGHLDSIIESPVGFRERRNRFLDHLLARFGETFTDYVLLAHTTGEAEGWDRLIDDKISFLEEVPVLSADRGKSYDYTDRDMLWNTDNVSGFKKRLCRLLGIRNYNRRSLVCKEADKFFTIYEDAAGEWRFRFRDETGSVLLRSPGFPTKEDCETAVESVKRLGGEEDHYVFLISKNNRFYFNLLDDNGRVLGTGLLFRTEEDRKFGLKYLTNKLGICNKEGFHLVEHLLLRPRQEGDPMLPVCLAGDGTACPGFRDPYSFRVSIIVPYWPRRFRSMDFRRLFEKAARLELPAHIHAKICWVNEKDMEKFENAYQPWLKAISRPVSNDLTNAAKKLIRVMAGIRSVYPVSKLHICSEDDEQNPILLDRSILGTIKSEES
jgi:uncharacterized protein YegP (UPF0339 family)